MVTAPGAPVPAPPAAPAAPASGGSAWEIAARVVDPELPVVTIAELGILREVTADGGTATVTITPTYSGCPALDAIRSDLATALRTAGWPAVTVVTRLSPPWTTDWITGPGRAKLAAAGIAPPGRARPPRDRLLPLLGPPAPVCPQCDSGEVDEVSRFGSTACTSVWRCRSCGEPFPHVKAV